jgi:hypothetical protein
MGNVMKERAEKKAVHGTMKKPYTTPRLTIHGDVEDITKVLRLAGAKFEPPGSFDFG